MRFDCAGAEMATMPEEAVADELPVVTLVAFLRAKDLRRCFLASARCVGFGLIEASASSASCSVAY